MKVSYQKLWHLLLDRRIKKKDLEQKVGITHYSVIQMGKNEPISLEVLVKICEYLDCGLDEIVEVVPDIDKNTTC